MYQALDQYMKDNLGQVGNFAAHTKAEAVVERWMQNKLERQGHARLYGTPHVDPLGSESFKDFLNQSRQERDDHYKDSNFLARGANWVLDKEKNKLEEYFGFDQGKPYREN